MELEELKEQVNSLTTRLEELETHLKIHKLINVLDRVPEPEPCTPETEAPCTQVSPERVDYSFCFSENMATAISYEDLKEAYDIGMVNLKRVPHETVAKQVKPYGEMLAYIEKHMAGRTQQELDEVQIVATRYYDEYVKIAADDLDDVVSDWCDLGTSLSTRIKELRWCGRLRREEHQYNFDDNYTSFKILFGWLAGA